MATREYCPGVGWTLVARGHLAVLLPAEQAQPLVPRLWDLLGGGTDLYGVLDALTAEFGFARLPAFGIAEHRERLRLLVRGAVDAAVTTAAGRERVSGADVGTWLERGVDGWTAVELVGADDGGPALPLEGGAVGAASVRVQAGVGTAPAPEAEQACAEAPDAALASTSAPAAAPARPAGTLDATIIPPTDTQLPAVEAPRSAAAEPAAEQTAGEAAPAGASAVAVDEPAPPAAPAEEHPTTTTSSYDQLFGSTVVRSVEDAAVRAVEAEEAPEQATDPLAPPQTTEPLAQPTAPQRPSPAAGWTPPSLLIDSVPWGGAAHAPEPRSEGRSITSELFGDHDGETVMRSELESFGEEPGEQAAAGDLGLTVPPPAGEDDAAGPHAPSSAARREGPLVLGRRCPRGHANPPSYGQCPTCGEPIAGEPEQLPRPALGRVRLSSGEVIELEEPLVVGRQPSVSRVASGGMPRLVTVASPSGDISRNHLEVRLEGWHVMVRDLKATNGTVLERPGQSPRRLAQGEMSIVLDGDVADLGDGVTLTFEAVP